MPMGKLDFLLGYALAFAVIAVVQALVVVSISLYALDLDIRGDAWQLGVVAVLDGVLGTALGLFASAFAVDRVPGGPDDAGRDDPAAPAAVDCCFRATSCPAYCMR